MSARGTEASGSLAPPLLGTPPPEHRAIELWAGLAYFAAAGYALLLLYLFVRPGGAGPVLAYTVGRPMVELVALVTVAFGLVWCALHRPFYQRRRVVPFACLALVVGAQALPFPYPSSHADKPSQVRFRLPFEGEWTVFWGGESSRENRLASYFADRRWGLDFIVTENGASHTASGLSPKDYFVYEREVLAPAEGTVVLVSSGLADSRPGIYDSRLPAFGNYVVIEVAPGEFVFLCHLLAGSIPVAVGQTVRAGELVGRVGNSGYSKITPQPHLAIHLQDSPEAGRGEAIPWEFCDYSSGARGSSVGCRAAESIATEVSWESTFNRSPFQTDNRRSVNGRAAPRLTRVEIALTYFAENFCRTPTGVEAGLAQSNPRDSPRPTPAPPVGPSTAREPND